MTRVWCGWFSWTGTCGVLGEMGVNGDSLYSSLTGVDPSRGYCVLKKAYKLLRGQGLEFGYLGTDEDYWGVLFYDVGGRRRVRGGCGWFCTQTQREV